MAVSPSVAIRLKLKKAKKLAQLLSAKVIGDEGEEY